MLVDGCIVVCDNCFTYLGEKENESSGEKRYCQVCQEVMPSGLQGIYKGLGDEFDSYLANHDRVIFAYSGGLDSTVVLTRLVQECRRRDIQLDTFTIDTGLKGSVALSNISSVVKWLGVDHQMIDIRTEAQSHPEVIELLGTALPINSVYFRCYELGVLPCGKLCNSMIDVVYQRVLSQNGYTELLTGGDTPKKGSDGKYSIHWQKPSGIRIVRTGAAFGIRKSLVAAAVRSDQIPWKHPLCGGYDTDCLVPGVIFADLFEGRPQTSYRRILDKAPIILDYLCERIRFRVFSRKEGQGMLNRADIASLSTYVEFSHLYRHWLASEKGERER